MDDGRSGREYFLSSLRRVVGGGFLTANVLNIPLHTGLSATVASRVRGWSAPRFLLRAASTPVYTANGLESVAVVFVD